MASTTALFTGLSGLISNSRRLDVIGNNISNVNTTAFKSNRMQFTPTFSRNFTLGTAPGTNSGGTNPGQVGLGVTVAGTQRNFNNGAIGATGVATDVAIEGDGFFVVRTPQGERYTRDGNMKLDATGKLVTTDGFPVLSDGGEITIPAGETNINIGSDGTVATAQGTAGKLRVVSLPPAALRKEGYNLYSATEPSAPATNARLVQGVIERSNVQPVVEMTKMIEIMRAYQSSSEAMSATNDLVRRAVQRLGEVKI